MLSGQDSKNANNSKLGPIECFVAKEWCIILKDTRVLKGIRVVTSCKNTNYPYCDRLF